MFTFILFLVVAAAPPLPTPVNEEIHDGDTIYVDFPGVPDVLGKHIGLRLRGADAPELRDPDPVIRAWAYKARDRLAAMHAAAKRREYANPTRDKYSGRLDVDYMLDGVNAAQQLIREGYAKPYNGDGPRPPWTRADIPTAK